LTATARYSAHRRWLELGGDAAEILAQAIERDARDMGRADAPLRAAVDAVVIDTTDLSVQDAVAAAIARVSAVIRP
jgi:cytidylate kinase